MVFNKLSTTDFLIFPVRKPLLIIFFKVSVIFDSVQFKHWEVDLVFVNLLKGFNFFAPVTFLNGV